MRNALLLVNPVFKNRISRDLPAILRSFNEAGIATEWLDMAPQRGGAEQAGKAIASGVDTIVVCGGDGSFFDVLQGAAGSNVALGILPLGTGNILAQNLKIPKHPVAAARWLLQARPRSIALGKITHCFLEGKQSWYFAMSAGMGVHAALMRAAERSSKDHRGRGAYFAAGLKLLFSHPLEPFDIEVMNVSGETFHRRVSEAIAVRVAELNLWRPGGGLDLPFLRLASIEAGSHGSRWRLAKASIEGLFFSAGARARTQRAGSVAWYEDVLRIVCRPVDGFRYASPLAVQADGEVLDASCAVIEMADVTVQMLAAGA